MSFVFFNPHRLILKNALYINEKNDCQKRFCESNTNCQFVWNLYFISQQNESGHAKYNLKANNVVFVQFPLPSSHLILSKCLNYKRKRKGKKEQLSVAKVIMSKSLSYIERECCNYAGQGFWATSPHNSLSVTYAMILCPWQSWRDQSQHLTSRWPSRSWPQAAMWPHMVAQLLRPACITKWQVS